MKAQKYIKYALDGIEELRQLSPDGVSVLKTYSGKLARPGIKGGDFAMMLKKIESKGIASFNEGRGNSAVGWGSNPLTIRVYNWHKFDEYYQEVNKELSSGKSKKLESGRGGDAGNIFIAARKIRGDGRMTADGGDGSIGGKGGKIAVISEDNQFRGDISAKGGKSQKEIEKWHQKWWGKIIIGVIIGLILLLIGFLI